MNNLKIVKNIAIDGKAANIVVNGVLGIEDAAALQGMFIEALAEAPNVVFDARGVEGIDMTILQVICSTCKTAADKNVIFSYEEQLPECMLVLSAAIGARTDAPCRQNNITTKCIWFGGEK